MSVEEKVIDLLSNADIAYISFRDFNEIYEKSFSGEYKDSGIKFDNKEDFEAFIKKFCDATCERGFDKDVCLQTWLFEADNKDYLRCTVASSNVHNGESPLMTVRRLRARYDKHKTTIDSNEPDVMSKYDYETMVRNINEINEIVGKYDIKPEQIGISPMHSLKCKMTDLNGIVASVKHHKE